MPRCRPGNSRAVEAGVLVEAAADSLAAADAVEWAGPHGLRRFSSSRAIARNSSWDSLTGSRHTIRRPARNFGSARALEARFIRRRSGARARFSAARAG